MSKQVSIRGETHAKLKAAAQKQGVTMAELLGDICDNFLDQKGRGNGRTKKK